MILLLALALQAAAPPPAGGFSHGEETAEIAFSYDWPAEAEAVPALRDMLRGDLARQRRLAFGFVREAQQRARENDSPFIPHHFEKFWSVAGTMSSCSA